MNKIKLNTSDIAKMIKRDKFDTNMLPKKPAKYMTEHKEFMKDLKKLLPTNDEMKDDIDFLLMKAIDLPPLYLQYLDNKDTVYPSSFKHKYADKIKEMKKDPYTKELLKYTKIVTKQSSNFYEDYITIESYKTLLYSLFLEGESAKHVMDKLITGKLLQPRDITKMEAMALQEIFDTMNKQIKEVIKKMI